MNKSMGEQKYIKDRKQITPQYCERLAVWIKENYKNFFSKENEADSWGDFIVWTDEKTDRNHLIMPGEVCIVDRVWDGVHTYCVCQFYGPESRKARDLYPVIAVNDLPRSEWRNGYFLIPNLNL